MAQKESGADTLLHVKKVSVRGGGFAKIAQQKNRQKHAVTHSRIPVSVDRLPYTHQPAEKNAFSQFLKKDYTIMLYLRKK